MAGVVAGFGMPATGGRLDQLAPGSTAALDPESSAAEKTGRRFAPQRRHILWLSLTAAAALAVVGIERRRGGEPSSHTASPEAAEAFERALEHMRLGRYQAAADQLREAARRDPAFALAHIVLAKVQMTLGRYSQGHESAQRAYELTTRNPERYTIWDHYRVLGRYKHLRREFSAARDDFRALAGFALERAEGLWFGREEYHAVAVEAFRERALIYSYEGFPREAREEIRKARQYDPRNPGLDVLESLFLVEQGNGSGALELAQQASRKAPKQGGQPYVYPAWAEGMAWLLLDNPIRARESFVQLSKAQGEPVLSAWGHLFEAQALVYSGEWQGAMEKLLETDTPDRSEMISEVWTRRQLWTAALASLMGLDWRGPLQRLEDVAGGDPSPQNGVVFRDAALLAVRHQDIATVQRFRRLLEAVERGFPALSSSSARPEVIPFVHHYAEHVRGEEARLLGQAGRSLRIFSDQAYLFLRDPQSWMSLAQVQASMGDWDQAIESYHQVLALKGRALTACACTVLPLAHLELARCFRQVSRSAQARQSYDAFLRNAGETELAAKVVAERNTLPL
jgi:tetratricopeptide (TPR) repeat protein